MHKLFENYSKCRIWILEFWHFPPIFVLLKVTCLAIVFDRKLQIFKNSPKWTIIGIFNQLSSIQNVSIARNVEWDFSVIFKHREVQFCLLQLHKTGCWIQCKSIIHYSIPPSWLSILTTFYEKNYFQMLFLAAAHDLCKPILIDFKSSWL